MSQSQFPFAPGEPKPPMNDKPTEETVEYLVVSDKNSEVILSSENLGDCRKLATKIRKCGGEVTLFKSIKF